MSHIEVKRKQLQLFSYILGAVFLLIIGRWLGDIAMAYFAVAAESLLFFFLLLVYHVPDALAKMLKARNIRNQFHNAARVRVYALVLQCVLGLTAGLLLFVLSDFITDTVFGLAYSAFALKILAPVIFLQVITGVLLGYFQSKGIETPTVAVYILRQVLFFGFTLLFGSILKGYGEKVSALLRDDVYIAMYSVTGMAIAMLLTEVLVVIFLIIIHIGSGMLYRKKNVKVEGLKMTETFGSAAGGLWRGMAYPVWLSLLLRLPIWLGLIIFSNYPLEYGIYYGKYLALSAIPILLICLLLLPVNARIRSCFKKDDQRIGKDLFRAGFHLGFADTLIIAVLAGVLSEELAGVLFPENTLQAAAMLQKGSALIVLLTLSIFLIQILVTADKNHFASCAVGIGNVCYIAGLIVFFSINKQGIMALVYAGLLGGGGLCLAAAVLVFMSIRTPIDPLRFLAVPAAAGAASGLVCMLFSKLLTPHLGNLVSLFIGGVVSLLLYWIILLLLRNFREQELKMVPGGGILLWFAKLLRFI